MIISQLFHWILRSSVMATAVVVLIFVIKVIIGKKLGARGHYLLWFMLFLRLLLPISLHSPVNIYHLIPFDESSLVHQSVSFSDNDPSWDLAVPTQDQTAPVSITQENNTARIPLMSGFQFRIETLYSLWLVGVLLFTLYTVFVNIKFHRSLKEGEHVTDDTVLQLLAACKKRMGIDRKITIIRLNKLQTPCLYGFISPKLLVPQSIEHKYTTEEIRFMLMHELSHLKNHDIAAAWLMGYLPWSQEVQESCK